MAKNNEISDIRSYRKKWQFNIGLIIFGIIFIYLVATVLMYFTADHITSYEVREGSILKDSAYTGVALREESLVNTAAPGYVNYYVTEGSKIRFGENIYTISAQKQETEEQQADAARELSSEEQNSLLLRIQKFNENSNDLTFHETYALKSDIQDTLQNITNQSKIDQLNEKMANAETADLSLYTAEDDGIIVYSIDQMEGLTLPDIKKSTFLKKNYKKQELQNNEELKADSPVYKLVTGETWTLVVELSDETAKQLVDTTNVQVHFTKDDETVWSELKIVEQDGAYMGCLSFDTGMIRYATERYLDVELIIEDKSGLKIPKTAETKKSFYVVPKEYITQGGNGKETGVLRQSSGKKGKETAEFVKTDIYYTKDDTVYLDPSIFEEGDSLIKPESNDTFSLTDKEDLAGVYNINKGYAVFKQIDILCESDEYYIIKEGSNYGLSNYDHIALNGSAIRENDVVFQ